MLDPQVKLLVGIDVAKATHTFCALEAPSGKVRQRPTSITATAEGYAELCHWLAQWGGPEGLLVGLEATGSLWEPLHDALTHAGYQVLVLNPLRPPPGRQVWAFAPRPMASTPRPSPADSSPATPGPAPYRPRPFKPCAN